MCTFKYTLENTEGASKHRQFRDTNNIGNTTHKTRQRKQKTQHNMCLTPPYTKHKMKTNKTKNTTLICVGHHHTQDTRQRQRKQKHNTNMCWTPPYTRYKTKTKKTKTQH